MDDLETAIAVIIIGAFGLVFLFRLACLVKPSYGPPDEDEEDIPKAKITKSARPGKLPKATVYQEKYRG